MIDYVYVTGYQVFESTVIGAYNAGKLDKDLLCVLMEPYRGVDMHGFGRQDLFTKDGKSVEHVTIEVFGLDAPVIPPCKYEENPAAWDAYHDKSFDQFAVVSKNFGWLDSAGAELAAAGAAAAIATSSDTLKNKE